VNHSGDRKDGVADGEDEFIVVDLAALPPFVTGLALSVHCFGSESFLAVETGSIHLSDVATGVRLSSQSVNGNQHTAVILYTIVRSPEGGSWLVTPAKTWCNGRTFMDILPLLQTEMHVDPVIAKECAGSSFHHKSCFSEMWSNVWFILIYRTSSSVQSCQRR
jgi:hypothetical protein